MELCMVPLVNLAPVTRTPTCLAVVLQFNSTYPPLLPPTKTPPSHLVQSWGVLLARILKASIHYTFLRLCSPCYKIPHHKTSSINPVFLTRPPCWLPTQAPLTTCSRINQRSSLIILSLDNEFGWATTPLLQSLATAQLSSPSMERKSSSGTVFTYRISATLSTVFEPINANADVASLVCTVLVCMSSFQPLS